MGQFDVNKLLKRLFKPVIPQYCQKCGKKLIVIEKNIRACYDKFTGEKQVEVNVYTQCLDYDEGCSVQDKNYGHDRYIETVWRYE